MLSIFNLMQTIAFYGFGSWVPTLLVAKGIQITTSLQYAFIIAIANPIGPLLGMLVADRMERKWQIVSAGLGIGIFMFLFAVQSSRRADYFSGRAGHAFEQLDVILISQLPGGVVSDARSRPRRGLRVRLEPRECRVRGPADRFLSAGRRRERRGSFHRRARWLS